MLAGGRAPMIRAAGAIADGLMGMPLCSPAFVEEVIRPMLADAADRAGREQPVPITGMTICAVSENSTQARALAATQLAVFAAGASAAPLIAFHGFEAEVAGDPRGVRAGRHPGRGGRRLGPDARHAGRPRNTEGGMGFHGTPKEAWERFAATFEGVYDEPLLFTAGKGMPKGGFEESLLGVCEAFGM
ncbi:hypothetical protein E1258_27400 [Micromonospora sp. KC207]|uniref:LLM class flavin-dependent oxidoreductase n=1 Tax=Micromonospora sp. KC207 TaxID=2530377 RepID=UPI00104EAD9E|nr:LLM class flavin-dependent oxidoreductase [Micromonospora sp. KC207]TDC49148.1 hypothetical protein E1258_27400 [Micromonospora sp. KC207]